MTYHTIESIRAAQAAVTPQQRETLSLIQWAERYCAAGPPLAPHQKALLDALMDQTRENPVQVILLKAPRWAGWRF